VARSMEWFICRLPDRFYPQKNVDPNEVGKAFGIASACEAIGAFVGGVAVQQLYRSTL
ncbi:Uncharacterised protein at_DN0946, partial [Pycnogonum litorale]